MSENLPGRIPPRIRVLVAVLLVSACASPDSKSREMRTESTGNRAVIAGSATAVRNVSTVPLQSRRLVENSTALMSQRQPGVWFTINDSGNEPQLFALDTVGFARGLWRVSGARNIDWEAASVGPCGAGGEAADCIYIADAGDNSGNRASVAIYRVVEPTALAPRSPEHETAIRAEMLQFAYPDRPHDVEAMYVAPNGDVVLITKRALKDRGGRLRQALVFRIPASAWKQPGVVVAILADSLPIVPGSVPFRLITDASLAPDAKHLAVRTYAEVYVFATDSSTGAVIHTVEPTVCDITPLSEYQGEGVTWASNRGRLLFTSEGRRSPLHLGDCGVPVVGSR